MEVLETRLIFFACHCEGVRQLAETVAIPNLKSEIASSFRCGIVTPRNDTGWLRGLFIVHYKLVLYVTRNCMGRGI